MLIAQASDDFILFLTAHKRAARNTVSAYRSDMAQFIRFCITQNVSEIAHLTTATNSAFMLFLKKDLNVCARSMARKIACIRAFYKFLTDKDLVTPAILSMTIPKQRQTLPKVLSREQMLKLLQVIDGAQTPIGSRNRIIFYLMYATGMRVSEVTTLHIGDLFLDEQLVRVHGKGAKERLVPIGAPLVALMRTYLEAVRPKLLGKNLSSEMVFPVARGRNSSSGSKGVRLARSRANQNGITQSSVFTVRVAGLLSRQTIWRMLNHAGKIVGCRLTPHMLRHTMATHLLHNGADLRSVQVLLGHEHVTTTQIYTHVDVHQLRAVYDAMHKRR